MAHLVETMAYVGATPWHGLGNNLPQKQPIEVWQREAGMDWQILESSVHFKSDAIGHLGTIHSFPEQKVLYRSDTKAPLSVVSSQGEQEGTRRTNRSSRQGESQTRQRQRARALITRIKRVLLVFTTKSLIAIGHISRQRNTVQYHHIQ